MGTARQEALSGWFYLLHDPLSRDALFVRNIGKNVNELEKEELKIWTQWIKEWIPLALGTLEVQKSMYLIDMDDSNVQPIVDLHFRITSLLEELQGSDAHEIRLRELVEDISSSITTCIQRVESRVAKVRQTSCPKSCSALENTILHRIACQKIASRSWRLICYWFSVPDRPHDVFGSHARDALVQMLPKHFRLLHTKFQMKRFRHTYLILQDQIETISSRFYE